MKLQKCEVEHHFAERRLSPPRVSFEFFPPRNPKMEETLWHAIRQLEPLGPTFVSVTYGAGGSTREETRRTVERMLEETSLLPAAHITCVGATREEIDAIVRNYWDKNIRHIVAIRGDPPGGLGERYEPHPGGYRTSSDLVAGIKACAPFEVSVGCYPEVHPEATSPEADIDALKRKVDAGCDRAITQFFFNVEVFLRFRDRVHAAGIDIPLVPGIMPVGNLNSVRKFAEKAGASIPDWVDVLFDGLDDDGNTRRLVAAAWAAELCLALRSHGVEEFHFYTMNRSELTYAVCRMLGVQPNSTVSTDTDRNAAE